MLKLKDENEIAKFVENLAIIMSSPKQASNPYAYIQAHQEEYENIARWKRSNTCCPSLKAAMPRASGAYHDAASGLLGMRTT